MKPKLPTAQLAAQQATQPIPDYPDSDPRPNTIVDREIGALIKANEHLRAMREGLNRKLEANEKSIVANHCLLVARQEHHKQVAAIQTSKGQPVVRFMDIDPLPVLEFVKNVASNQSGGNVS